MEARFAIAERHSRIVRALRIAVPAAVILSLAAIILLPALVPAGGGTPAGLSSSASPCASTRSIMGNLLELPAPTKTKSCRSTYRCLPVVLVSRFSVLGSTDHITPPDEVFALATHASTPPELVTRHVSTGGHLGLFMGREALREHWPRVLAEVFQHSRAGSRR